MDSYVVIKVKYAETLRRFNARIVDVKMDKLREWIVGLFKFSPDTEFTMTYVDEDNDVVTLADDRDLRDVARRGLNPLRITVNLSTVRSEKSSSSRTSRTSTPLRSNQVQQPLVNFNSEILNSIPESLVQQPLENFNSEILNSIPEPLVQQPLENFDSEILNSIPEPLGRIFTNFATSATSLQHLLEMCLNQLSGRPQSGPVDATAQDGASGGPKINEAGDVVVAAAHDVLSGDRSEKVCANSKPEAGLKTNKTTKSQSGTARTIPGLEDLIRAALDSVTESAPVGPKLPSISQTNVGKNKLSPSGAPPVSKSVHGEKSTSSNIPKTTINPFPSPFFSGPCSNLNSQPTPTPSSEGIRNTMFGSTPGNSSTSNPVPSPMSECPFTGMPLGSSSATHPFVAQSRRNQRQGEGPVMIFHRGVRCHGCGVHPITGTRFKAKVKEEYDLCTCCFGKMGNEEDYIRMDRPILTYSHSFSFKPTRGNPAHPQVFRGCGMKPSGSKLDSRFIQEMNVSYDTLMAPLTPFTKIWRVKNNGAVVWPKGTQLVWIGGDKLTDVFSVELEIADAGLPVDKELDIAVDFVAPKHPGQYISYWKMASPSGQKFGQQVWVLIQVDAKELPRESFHSFNLNLPPASNGISYPEIINVNPEPMVEDVLSDLGLTDLRVHKEQDVNFPINDSLLVGGAVSRPEPSAPSASLLFYPTVDLSEVAPAPVPVQTPVAVTVSVVKKPPQPVERNKKLLKKNIGRIKRVIMELLSGVKRCDPE